MSDTTVIRVDTQASIPWFQVSRKLAQDERLSFDQRGLMVYLLSKPANWSINIKDIMREGGIGRDKAQRLVNELKDLGYIEYVKERDDGGAFSGGHYRVYDLPEMNPSTAALKIRPPVEPDAGKSATYSKESSYSSEILPAAEPNPLTARYSKDSSSPNMDYPSPNMDYPSPNMDSKKEPIKKEPVKNTTSPAAKEPTELQRITNLLIWFCTGVNFGDKNEDPGRKKLITYSRYVREAKNIIEAGRTEQDMRAWWSQVWVKGWRFQKNKQLPSTNQVLEGLAKVGTYAPDIKDEVVTIAI